MKYGPSTRAQRHPSHILSYLNLLIGHIRRLLLNSETITSFGNSDEFTMKTGETGGNRGRGQLPIVSPLAMSPCTPLRLPYFRPQCLGPTCAGQPLSFVAVPVACFAEDYYAGQGRERQGKRRQQPCFPKGAVLFINGTAGEGRPAGPPRPSVAS